MGWGDDAFKYMTGVDPEKMKKKAAGTGRIDDVVNKALGTPTTPAAPPSEVSPPIPQLTPEEEAAAAARKAQVDAGIAELLEKQKKRQGMAYPGAQ